MNKILSQESRIKLQDLINYPVVTNVAIQDRRVIYSPGNEEVYADANVHATCELETMKKILFENGIPCTEPRDFTCDHGTFLSVGHSFDGEIEGCNISFIVTKNVKKAPADAEELKENFLPDNSIVWDAESIMRQEG